MWGSLRVARSRLVCGRSLAVRRTGASASSRITGASVEWRGFSTRSELGGTNGAPLDFMLEDEDAQEQERLRKEELKEQIAAKKGRGWTDPWDLQEMYESKVDYDQLPDWSPSLVSRISQERVQIHPDKIPTLKDLTLLPLPPPPAPHPGHGQTKLYALHRERSQYKYVLGKVSEMTAPKIGAIQALSGWEDKQDAVDELFENIEFELKEKEVILGKHPKFGTWVERALEEYLRIAQKSEGEDQGEPISADTNDAVTAETGAPPTAEQDEAAVPVFMDCYSAEDPDDQVVPTILSPMEPHPRGSAGRMVEEWELAAHKESKRIMMRQSTRQIACALEESKQARIYVHGRQGVGKTAALATIVASARKSGKIVLFLQDGDRLRKNGFYTEPNAKRSGIYDLPVLSEKVCADFLAAHKDDISSMKVDKATIDKYFTEEQQERLEGLSGGSMQLVDLLEFASERIAYAPMCYSAMVDVLMNQEDKDFVMVLDEFNCYFEPGHYYHADYDEDVKKPIPNEQISLFKPAMDAMAVSIEDNDDEASESPMIMKRGAVIVATTESHAIPRKVTDALATSVQREASSDAASSIPMFSIEVPRFSPLEVEHILANFECIGLGKLRLDQGDTVMNDQEVVFLRMVSDGVGQRLMDASIM